MKYDTRRLSRFWAARLLAPPVARTVLGVHPLEARDNPAGTYTGVAFQDFNANGVRDLTQTLANKGQTTTTVSAAVDQGVAGVTVTAYTGVNTVAGTTVTDSAGAYTLTPTGAGPYRIAFTAPAGYTPGPRGADSGSTTQFVPDGGATASVGLVRAGQYAQDDPLLAFTQFTAGTAVGRADPAILGVPYSAGGVTGGFTAPAPTFSVPTSQVGTVHSLAYNTTTSTLYATAFFKRHAGFGPNGPGAVYQVPVTTAGVAGAATLFADLNTLFPAALPAGTDQHNPLNFDTDNGNAGWAAAGTTGLGGAALSPDGKFLYVMALGDRRLYKIPTNVTPTAANVTSVSISLANPDTTGTVIPDTGTVGFGDNDGFASADLRPFSVDFYNGELYIGATYTAQTFAQSSAAAATQTAARNQLLAAVYKVDPAALTVTAAPVFTARLNYARDVSAIRFAGASTTVSPWRPWSPTYVNYSGTAVQSVAPQALLTQVSFDAAGNINLGLRDRGADQTGFFAESDPSRSTSRLEGVSAGDVLRAFANTPGNTAGGWTLENNGRGPNGEGTAGTTANVGPGGAEFFYQDGFPKGIDDTHGELALGAAIQLPGRPDAVSTEFDPGNQTLAGGLAWSNTQAGTKTKAFQSYQTPNNRNGFQESTFSKANGIGGLTALVAPAPVEIGDRVFFDANSDGIQGAAEAGIPGVTVQLLSGGTVIATAVTDADGLYLFSSAAVAGEDASRVYNVNLVAGQSYTVRVPNAAGGAKQAALGTNLVTAAAAGADRSIDSNGTLAGANDDYAFTAGAATDHTLDFGFAPAFSIGNRVWLDRNNSGTIDAADTAAPGVDGVRVVLFNATAAGVPVGAAVGTAVTAAGGYYRFDGLPAGTYVVRVDTTSAPLAGLTPSTPNAFPAGVDSRNRGTVSGAGFVGTGAVVLGPTSTSAPTGEADTGPGDAGIPDGQADLTQDFGFVALNSVSGFIYDDTANNDGSRGTPAAEPLITGQTVTVTLTGTDAFGTAVALTTTTATGAYSFTGLLPSNAAGYTITEVNQPTGFLDGKDKAGTPFGGTGTTAAGDAITGVVIGNDGLVKAGTEYNFGELRPATLGDTVFLDANGNGRFDGTDAGVPGVTVTLAGTDDRGAAVAATTVTGAGGVYTFGTLRPGTYTVTFGNTAAGVTYTRTTPNAPGSTAANDSNAAVADGKTAGITLAAGQTDLTIDAGLYQLVSVGDRVWLDANADGVQDAVATEPGIVGATVTLVSAGPDGDFATTADNVTLTTVTGVNGAYTFTNLVPATFKVTVTPPAATPYTATYDRDSGTTNPDGTVTLTIPSGQNPTDVDFGFRTLGSIGDRVWFDRNGDGKQDAGEPGLPGLTVTLFDAANKAISTTVTGADGAYTFPNLPTGTYRVTVATAGTNLSSTYDLDSGTTAPDGTTAVALTVANPSTTLADFGLRGNSSVGDLVWYDVDGGGTQTNAEPGLPGVTVTLTGAGADNKLGTADDLTLTTVTDAAGAYLFPFLPTFGTGTPYVVTVTPPAAYPAQTFDADGVATANQSTTTLPANTADLKQDFGYRGPVTQGLGDFVFLDANGNGRQDAGEAGVNGVTVSLLDAAGKVLATTVTAPSGATQGYYEFRGLAASSVAGDYAVQFGNTAGGVTYTRTVPTAAGATPATDSNAAVADGKTGPVTIAAATFDPTIDAGLYQLARIGDTVWYDIDGNGTKAATEPGLGGVTVTLDYAGPDGVFGTRDDQPGLATATTAADGTYLFPNLTPGTYRVTVTPATLPAGLTAPTFDLDGTGTANVAVGSVGSGLTNPDFDFGYRGVGSLGDLVWYDLDKSGTVTNGEPGIGGVRVTLVGAGFDNTFGTADDIAYGTQTTTAAGAYLFGNLPAGTYRATVDPASLPAGVTVATYDLDSGLASPDSTTVAPLTAAAPTLLTADFGYAGTGSIGDRVFVDANANGVQDPGEPGIPGVTVTLVWFGPDGKAGGGDDVTETAVTGANGIYTFGNLPPGNFRVTSGTPAGTAISSDPDAALDGTTLVTLTPGQVVVTADFGYKGLSSLAGNVFVDADASNTRNSPPDTPIGGVPVTLTGTDAFGNPVTATTATAAAGTYSFPNLVPGTYAVTETQPANYGNGPTLVGSAAGTKGSDTVTAIALGANVAATGYDFGEIVGVIGGRVVYDRNQDGVLAPTETGIGGVTVTLLDATGKSVTTAVTGADGSYQFTGLTGGTYTVTETQPAGYGNTPTGPFAPDTRPVTLPAGGAVTGQNFLDTLGTLSGRVVVDTATPNTPIAGVTLTLVNAAGATVATTTTAADGTYQFPGLPAGTYTVTEAQPAQYLDGPDVVGNFGGTVTPPDTLAAIPIPAGGAAVNYDFRELVPGSVSGVVYTDTNRDGTQGPGEPGIPGVTVQLVDSTGAVVGTTTTTAAGGYQFPNVPPGTYTVRETQPAGYADTPTGPDATNTRPVTVTPTTPGVANFGEILGTLSGRVVVDTATPNTPIAGVTLTLVNAAGATVATTTTAADGTYQFPGLPAGTYTVTEAQPAQYLDGPDVVGNFGGTVTPPDTLAAIPIPAGEAAVNYDFRELVPQVVTGTVYLDRGQDGGRSPGDPGIAGVTVQLRDPAGNVVGTTTTGPDGTFTFPNVPPGTYTVREIQPAGYGDSPAGPERTNDRPVTVTPTTPGVANFADALGAVSGTVYLDANRNGQLDPGEPGIGGVTLVLSSPAAGLTTTTAADGTYSFPGLPAGTYTVTETQPAGVSQGTNTAGPAGGSLGPVDVITGIPVTPPAGSPANNFGELPFPDITGVVFNDRNRDGTQGAGEPGIPGVVIQLLDPAGRVVGTATTDATGAYRIPNVAPGSYTVREIQPAGYANTTSPTNQANDRPLTVGTGGVSATVFADILSTLSGTVYRDFNLDGTRTPTGAAPDTGIAGVTVTLLNGTGAVVGTTTTNAAGFYQFTELPAGTYTVVETQPPLPTSLTNGFYDGSDTVGSLGGTSPAKNRTQVPVGAGVDGVNYDFGELPPADPFGFVYLDANKNGVRDPGEVGIPNVAVTVAGTAFAGTPFARPIAGADVPGGSLTVRTGADGKYEFSPIPPGLYSLSEAQPAAYQDGLEQNADPAGPNTVVVGNDVFSNVLLAPTPVRGPFNFGEIQTPLAVGPLQALDFFPATVTAGPTDPTKRAFLSSTAAGPGATTTVPNTAPVLPTAPAFGGTPAKATTYVAAAQDAGGGVVRVFDFTTGIERFRFQPFPDFTGGVRVTTADVTGDGIPDIVATPGAGGGPIVRVFDGSTGAQIRSVMAFESDFRGGLQVAAADITGDGRADLIVTPDAGGGPIIRAFDGVTGATVANFFALDDTFRGGLRIAAGDLNGDGTKDLVVTAGVGGGPRVAAYDGKTLTTTQTRLFGDFFAFAPELRSGYWVTAGDVDGDGNADIVVSAGPGGGPRVVAYSGKTLTGGGGPVELADFFAGDVASRSGVRVTAADLTNDGRAELIAAPGAGERAVTKVYDPLTGALKDQFYAFPTDFLGGVYLG